MGKWVSKEDFVQAEGNDLQMHKSDAVYVASFGGRQNDGAKLPGQRNERHDLNNLFAATGDQTAGTTTGRTTIGFEVGDSEAAERLRKQGLFKVPEFIEFKDPTSSRDSSSSTYTGNGRPEDPPEKPVISVGPAMSGLSFHSHGEAW